MLVTWSYNSPHGQAFELQRKAASDATWEPVATLTPDVREYLDEAALAPDTTYTYRAKATRSTPEWVESAWVQTSVKVPQVPEPTGLTAKSVSPSEINLMWVEKVTGEDGFVVQMSNDGGETFANRATLPPNARHYSAIGLAPETTYEFRLATTRGGHLSEYSSVASATTRPLPEEDPDGDPTNNPPPPLDPGWWEPVDSVTPDIMDASTEYFAGGESLEPGSYRVMYESGGVDFDKNRYGWWGSAGYVVTPSGEVLPGSAVHVSEEAVELAMAGQGVSVGHSGGPLGVSFGDSVYWDNEGSGVTWRLERYHPPEPPPQPPVDDPNTNDTDEGPSTISISVNPEHAVATEGGEEYIELVFSRGTGPSGKKRPKVDVYYTLAGTATPQADYTGPAGGTGFAGVYKVTIPADSGSSDEANDGVSATVQVKAKDMVVDDVQEDARTLFASLRATGLYFIGAPRMATGTIADGTIKIGELTYSGSSTAGYLSIARDNGTGTYSGPHWKDVNGDGDAEDAGESKWPAAYVRNSVAAIEAKFSLPVGLTPTGTIRVRGINPAFPEYYFWADSNGTAGSSVTVSGLTMTVTATSNSSFPNWIDHFDTFDIKWEVAIGGAALDAKWRNAGTTKNQLYVTLERDPQLNASYFHTVLHVSTRAAKGLADPPTVVNAIWNEFKDRTVFSVHDTLQLEPLKYRHSPIDTLGSTLGLLMNGAGRCGTWAEFFIDTLEVHGIEAQRVLVKPDLRQPPQNPQGLPAGFANVPQETLIKVKPGPAQGTFGANYTMMIDFIDHAVVKVPIMGNTIYDPSYGGLPFTGLTMSSAEIAWEDFSMSGLVYTYTNGATKWWYDDPNRPGVADVDFRP